MSWHAVGTRQLIIHCFMPKVYKQIIPHFFVGLLYEDGEFKRVLPPGKHRVRGYFFDTVKREIKLVDRREQSLTIKGQEILTKDKVAIRISLLVYYKIINHEAAIHNVVSYEERIYEDVQLAARRFLANHNLDDILSDRNEISDAVRDDVKNSAASYGVEIIRADVKDLVFPGNLREIMNRVLEVERESETILIKARKEAEASQIATASATERVLQEARTEMEKRKIQLQDEIDEAKLLEQHPVLLTLRRINALSDIAQKGGKFVVGLNGEESDNLTKF